MSWTGPVTRATGYIVLATDYNAIETNLEWLYENHDRVVYKKTSVKAVNSTTTATDLLNGEVVIGAGGMGTAGILRLTAWGDFLSNTGSNRDLPGFQFQVGGTVLIDTGNAGSAVAATTNTRCPWRMQFEFQNLGVANSQQVFMTGSLMYPGAATFSAAFNTGIGAIHSGATVQDDAEYAGGNTSAIDTTVSRVILLNVYNAVASANYETRLLGALVELL